jgi:hypothetical protein
MKMTKGPVAGGRLPLSVAACSRGSAGRWTSSAGGNVRRVVGKVKAPGMAASDMPIRCRRARGPGAPGNARWKGSTDVSRRPTPARSKPPSTRSTLLVAAIRKCKDQMIVPAQARLVAR